MDGSPDVVDNPLYSAPADGGASRDPSMVYALGVVGVPWQTIRATTDASGNPIPPTELVYPSGSDLDRAGIWEKVLGEPRTSPPVPPADPLMIESIAPRTGNTPGTGEALAPPSAGYLANSVNGHETDYANADDLQFACTIALAQPRDCVAIAALPDPRPGCDCLPTSSDWSDNPLCQAADGSYGTDQLFAKAYPGLRHLEWLKGLGDNAALGSICARNLTDPALSDYGYRAAVDALARELGRTIR